jgi:uncharacterized membrane protein YheB (UPF0754 family)
MSVAALKDKSFLTNFLAVLVIVAGYASPIWKEEFVNVGAFALSGAITNWIAIYMLFEKVPFLYGSGVVPTRFEEFKSGIKNLIMGQFFTQENLRKFLDEKAHEVLESNQAAHSIIDEIDYDQLYAKLAAALLESPAGSLLGMLGGAKILESFKEPIMRKLKEQIFELWTDPKFQSKVINAFSRFSDADSTYTYIDGIVQARLDELTPNMVKEIVKDMINKHLGWLVVWGGVFGGLIGLAEAMVSRWL